MCNELLAQSQPSSKVLTMNQTDAFLLLLLLLLITPNNSCRSKFQISCAFLVIQSNPSPVKHLATQSFWQPEVVNLAKTEAKYAPCLISTTECSTYLLLLHILADCVLHTEDKDKGVNLMWMVRIGQWWPQRGPRNVSVLLAYNASTKQKKEARCVLSGSYLRRHRTSDLMQDRALA